MFSPPITLPFSETVCWTGLSMCVCATIAGKESLSAGKLVHQRLEFVCGKCSLLQNFSTSRPGLIWTCFLINKDQVYLKCCLGSLKILSLASLQGPKELIDLWGAGLYRAICSSSSSLRRSQQLLWDAMVTGTLGAFAGRGQLFSMTETRKDKDLNVVSALFSPCECRIPVFQHEFHTGRTSFSFCCNIPFCILVWQNFM